MVRQRTRKHRTLPDPQRFNLESFAAILPQREALVGEDARSWEVFHASMLESLSPATPYEAVIAENLIAIEWELLQHRSMRDATLRKAIRRAIRRAATNADTAAGIAADLADRAVSKDPAVRNSAYEQIRQLGMAPIDLMAEAYRGTLSASPDQQSSIPSFDPLAPGPMVTYEPAPPDKSAEYHDEKIRQLERRRREVKRDYDQLQQSRPDKGAIIEQ